MRIVKETGKPVAQVARDLGISPYTLHNWVKNDRDQGRAQDGELGESERQELVRLVASTEVVYEFDLVRGRGVVT